MLSQAIPHAEPLSLAGAERLPPLITWVWGGSFARQPSKRR